MRRLWREVEGWQDSTAEDARDKIFTTGGTESHSRLQALRSCLNLSRSTNSGTATMALARAEPSSWGQLHCRVRPTKSAGDGEIDDFVDYIEEECDQKSRAGVLHVEFDAEG